MRSLKQDFISDLRRHHPALVTEPLEDLVSDNLLSPFVLRLPKKVLDGIHKAVAAVHALRSELTANRTETNSPHGMIPNPGHLATMMSLDFHVAGESDLKLIEINTNASFLILAWEMYRLRGLPYPATDFSPDRWREDLLGEIRAGATRVGKAPSSIPRVAIVDEKPAEQRLYLEFLVAREWLKSFGWHAEIRDVLHAVDEPLPDLIYNRATDFFLTEPASAGLRDAFYNARACVSPNPFEYALLADKERLVEWSRPGYFENSAIVPEHRATLEAMIPASFELTAANAEEMWTRRREFFFKPLREFGSKLAYRGSSISKKHYQGILGGEMMAQEFVPPATVTFEMPSGPTEYKYDLRCHFHGGRLESVVARLYQGQVTNLRTEGGGFTPVVFE